MFCGCQQGPEGACSLVWELQEPMGKLGLTSQWNSPVLVTGDQSGFWVATIQDIWWHHGVFEAVYFGRHGCYPKSGVMCFICRHLNPQPQACFLPGQRANAITSVTNLHSWTLSLLTETFIWDSGELGHQTGSKVQQALCWPVYECLLACRTKQQKLSRQRWPFVVENESPTHEERFKGTDNSEKFENKKQLPWAWRKTRAHICTQGQRKAQLPLQPAAWRPSLPTQAFSVSCKRNFCLFEFISFWRNRGCFQNRGGVGV